MTAAQPQRRIDWRRVAATACLKADWSRVVIGALGSAALESLVLDSIRRLGHRLEADVNAAAVETSAGEADEAVEAGDGDETTATNKGGSDETAEAEPSRTIRPAADEHVLHAAEVLGVEPWASEDAIRATLRARLASSRLHPDQGGDGQEATSLIAAKNLLIERARAMRP